MEVKRGISRGFAGVENEPYFLEKNLILLGDAGQVADGLLREPEYLVSA